MKSVVFWGALLFSMQTFAGVTAKCGDMIQAARSSCDEAAASGKANGPESILFLQKATDALDACTNLSQKRGSVASMLRLAKQNCDLAGEGATILFLANCYYDASQLGHTTMARDNDPVGH